MTITKMVRQAKENNPGAAANQKRSIMDMPMFQVGQKKKTPVVEAEHSLDQFKFSGKGVKQSSSIKSTLAAAVAKNNNATTPAIQQTNSILQSADSAKKVQTKMGIGSLENKEKITSTTDLISSLKKVFSGNELKVIVTCL